MQSQPLSCRRHAGGGLLVAALLAAAGTAADTPATLQDSAAQLRMSPRLTQPVPRQTRGATAPARTSAAASKHKLGASSGARNSPVAVLGALLLALTGAAAGAGLQRRLRPQRLIAANAIMRGRIGELEEKLRATAAEPAPGAAAAAAFAPPPRAPAAGRALSTPENELAARDDVIAALGEDVEQLQAQCDALTRQLHEARRAIAGAEAGIETAPANQLAPDVESLRIEVATQAEIITDLESELAAREATMRALREEQTTWQALGQRQDDDELLETASG